MASFGTFDLGSVYARGEQIKTARADREYKQKYLENLNEQEARHWAEMQQKNSFQSLYSELQTVKAMPEEEQRKWLASKPIGQDPRFANANPADLIRAMEAGVLVGMGKAPPEPPKPDRPNLYLTEKGYLPADQAQGLNPPAPQRAEPGPVSLQRKTRHYKQDGKAMAQDYNFNPRTGESKPVGEPYEVEPRRAPDPLEDWGDGEDEQPPVGATGKDAEGNWVGTSKSGKPMIWRNGAWEYL